MNRREPWPDDTDYEANPSANAASDEWLADYRASEDSAWAEPVERNLRMLSFADMLRALADEHIKRRRRELRKATRESKGNQKTVRDAEDDDLQVTDDLRKELAAAWAHEARQFLAAGQTFSKQALAKKIANLKPKAARSCIVAGLRMNGDEALWQDNRGRPKKSTPN